MPKKVIKTTTVQTTAHNGNVSMVTFTHIKKDNPSKKGKW